MKSKYNYCIFILSHGRPHNQYTYNTLKRIGNTAKVFFVLDDEDDTREEYERIYGKSSIVTFSKKIQALKTDHGDSLGLGPIVLYARNACFDIAKKLGYDYFLEFDDDYSVFEFRFSKDCVFGHYKLNKFNYIIEQAIEMLECDTRIKSIAFSQGGDFIGGPITNPNAERITLLRKCMNTFICKTDRRFKFFGRINEDVNTYVTLGNRGDLFFTINYINVEQKYTQQQPGGLTDAYLSLGTYTKSFYSVLYAPSCVKLGVMGLVDDRIHHKVYWNNAVPKIISCKHKKI